MDHYSLHAAISLAPGHPEQAAACAVCGNNHPFEFPPDLVDAALAGDLVVFAGAGVSTEARVVGEATLYDRIAGELELTDSELTFPSLMSAYVTKHGRRQLLQRVRERLEYIAAHPELWHFATRFHHALATAFFLRNVVTTNWDTYFEDVCAAIPIVVPPDYAFWEMPGRKVFKLHGSMHNLGTIVATEADYNGCYRRLRSGLIGSTFKHMLATRRMVFIGYSFRDPDLTRILSYLKRELAGVLPQSWLVSPHGAATRDFPTERIIATDGTYFIHKLKEVAVERGVMRPDSAYFRTFELADRLSTARKRLHGTDLRRQPAAVHAMVYQDGLGHALERIGRMIPSGDYSDPHRTYHLMRSYEMALTGAVRKRHYIQASYIEGYLTDSYR